MLSVDGATRCAEDAGEPLAELREPARVRCVDVVPCARLEPIAADATRLDEVRVETLEIASPPDAAAPEPDSAAIPQVSQ